MLPFFRAMARPAWSASLAAVCALAPVALTPLVATIGAQPLPRRAEHVVLISIDGLRPDFYLEPSSWGAPTIQQMAAAGVKALGVRGVFPSVTYPSHTTLLTGAMPSRHGVFYNTPFEPDGQTGRWYWESEAIKVPTLFSALKSAGRTSAAVMWPVTVGAPVDFLIPEVYPLDRSIDQVVTIRAAATPGLLEEIEREATGRLTTARNFGGDDLTRDDRLGAMGAYLLETRKPALLALHLIGADHFQHEEGRDGPKVQRAVAALDRAVGQVMEAAERAGILGQTAFIITGDHGFVNTQSRVDPNVWLANAGLLDTTRTRGNWRAAFHVEGAAAFLHTRTRNDTAAVAQARRAIDAVPAAEHKLFRVVERDELDRIGADPRVPFALTSQQGVRMGAGAVGPAIKPSNGGTHGFFPTDFPEIRTGFIGWGAGFRAGMTIPEMGLEDVAPLVAELLGLPFSAPDGIAPSGVLTASPTRVSSPK